MPNIPVDYQNLPGLIAGQYDIQMVRLSLAIADVLTEYGFSTGGGGGGGSATAANQTAVQENAGSDASKAVSVQGITGAIPVIVSGITNGATEISDDYTRPANTDAYSTNDALSESTTTPTALVFPGVARTSNGSGYITQAHCFTSQITMTGALRLHLFKSSPTPINDNDAFTLLAVNIANYIGYIDFSSFVSGGSGSDIAVAVGIFPQSRLIPFTASGTDIYGLVQVVTGFTPDSGQTFAFYLGVEQN